MKNPSTQVLLIDDEADMRDLIEEELTRRGYQVTGVSSGERAIEKLRAMDDEFTVVLTDVNMNGMSGIDLCARVRELRANLPVVVMTACGSPETASAATRAGACDFVLKPFDFATLGHVLERARASRYDDVPRLRQASDECSPTDLSAAWRTARRRDAARFANRLPTTTSERNLRMNTSNVMDDDDCIANRDWEGPIPGITPASHPRERAPGFAARTRNLFGALIRTAAGALRSRPVTVLGAVLGVGAIACAAMRVASRRGAWPATA